MNPHRRMMLGVLAAACLQAGCVSLVADRAADTLSAGILDQSDPETVRDGAPAYLLLLDGMIVQDPDNESLLTASAQLNAAYGALFADDPQRAVRLTEKARQYGLRAVCDRYQPACSWEDDDFDSYQASLAGLGKDDVPALYAYLVGWLANLQATSDDWGTVADLPRAQALVDRMLALDGSYQNGSIYVYAGQLATLRPPSLGGKPEEGRRDFERAIEISGGRNLNAKVEYARSYARLVYDRELHDRLLKEVLAAPAEAPGMTLLNTLAKRQAAQLLASADDYF